MKALTMNMNPKNLMILAALGIAAYYFTTRRAMAAPAGATSQPGRGRPIRSTYPTAVPASPNQAAAGDLGRTAGDIWRFVSGFGQPQPINTSTPGYVPRYVPDATGESAARTYYIDNQDTFANNPPTQYVQPSGSDLIDDN
jgi:hypothetical protein